MNVVVFDLETTGLSPQRDAIVEIGAMRVRDGRVVEDERFETLVRPLSGDGHPLRIPWRAQQVHGISDAMVRDAPDLGDVLPQFLDFVGDSVVVAHNISFDTSFLRAATGRYGLRWAPPAQHCTLQLSRQAFPAERSHRLDLLAERLGLSFAPGGRHRSLGDVRVTAEAYLRLLERLRVGV
ncbi:MULTISPECIES: 3'-5' exonuclease [Deinococcus]|uniref:3'-5' exonuclease n=1 Tax=Deinococcus TaxID=1298 RepID=UPI0004844DA0|nr:MULTISPECIES: 3'-5' exonuclease [Deinococcus]KEF35589.1 DNA polymerase III subunit epsilon [Deinococcus sp. RL]